MPAKWYSKQGAQADFNIMQEVTSTQNSHLRRYLEPAAQFDWVTSPNCYRRIYQVADDKTNT